MNISGISGRLEIDHDRGVIYFHTDDPKIMEKYRAVTILRICKLPTPIPSCCQLDITYMYGVGWHESTLRHTLVSGNVFSDLKRKVR